MRGENFIVFTLPEKDTGSPPLARGKRKATTAFTAKPGITPACAGKTEYIFSDVTIDKDHPRLRGENHCTPAVPPQHPGSPPLARGKLSDIHYDVYMRRITPACAGKTFRIVANNG